jgi:mRNA interferase RelE/StbE
MYPVIYKKAATKALARMLKPIRNKLIAEINLIASSPDRSDLDVKPLQGRPGYRLRVAKWRVIYHREDERLLIVVVDAGSRGDIYK